MSNHGKKVAKDARTIAFQVLCRVEEGAYSDLTLDGMLRAVPDLDSRERGLATELVYGVLRRRGNLDYILAAYSRQPLARLEPAVLCLLRIGVYQLYYLDKIPQRAAVHSTVELARQLRLERVTGLINGTLRACVREPQRVNWPQAQHDPLGWLCHRLSLPQWLAERWLDRFGLEEAGLLAEALLQPPPVTLRVNRLKISRDNFLQQLLDAGIAARPTRFAADGVVLEQGSARAIAGLDASCYQMQDEASMLIASLLQVQPGQKILDVCAAPGGKTTHLAALTDNQADIVAMDLHPQRLALLKEGAQRLGCQSITLQPWDMTQRCDLYAEGYFDRVLVDAPCSGLGVLRRNPEARWRRSSEDILRLATLQAQILANAAALVANGGLLVYSLCTTTPEESQQVVRTFLEQHPQFERQDLRAQVAPHWQELFDDQGCLSTLSSHHDHMDCFFACALRRRCC